MDYQFKPLGKVCATTGKPLVPGSWCHSVVVERSGQQLRLDFSEEGWRGPPSDAIGAWRCQVPLPRNPQNIRIDPDALMRYFEQLCEEASPAQETQRYICALLLLKWKRLRLDDVAGTADDDRPDEHILILEGTHGEGRFEVRNLQLPDDEALQLQNQLRTQLAGEWT